MLSREFIHPLFDVLSFYQIFQLCKVCKTMWISSKDPTYWRRRSNDNKILYLSPTIDERVNYAWSMVNAKSLNPDFYVFLSRTPNLLFRGLEHLIGLPSFIHRCVQLKNEEMLIYGISLGPKSIKHYIIEIISYIKSDWSIWHNWFNSLTQKRYQDYQLWYNELKILTSTDDKIAFFQNHDALINPDLYQEEMVKLYLTDLLIYGEEDTFFDIKQHLNYNVDFQVGYFGSISLVTKLLGKPNLNLEMRMSNYPNRWREILRGAVEGNNIILVEHILKENTARLDLPFIIKSSEMLDVLILSKRVPWINLIKGVMVTGNYRLFFYLLPTIKKTDIGKTFHIDAPPMLLQLIISKSTKSPLTKCRDQGLPIYFPFQYNALREMGMERCHIKIKDRLEYINLELLPWYKADL